LYPPPLLPPPMPSPPTSRPFSPDLPIRPSSTTHLNDSTHHARFLHTPGGSPSARHQSLPPQQHAASLNRRRSEPDIRSVAAQPAPHHPISKATRMHYQQRQWRQQHRQSFDSVTPPSPADRRPSTAGSAASSGGEPRGDIRTESLQDVTAVAPTQGLPPITIGDQNASLVERYHSAFSNPFSEHNVATRSRSSGVFGVDTAQARLHSPASSLVPIARPVASDEEQDAVPPDPSVSKTYSFVSLPGNAVRKRPRHRYDEIERLYHCSWSGCTKSYGTLNHLNAHIVMQRHGNKRTPAEFKELRKQWRKAKKEGSERDARLERAEERFNMSSVQAALPPSQSYERQPMPQSYGRQQLYGPGMFGPEMDQHEAVSGYPPSTETSSMRPQPLRQQYGYGATRSLYPVVPTTPIPSSWPEQSTQYEGSTPPPAGRS
jgi:hypothetical protein